MSNKTIPTGALYHDAIAHKWSDGYKKRGFMRRYQNLKHIMHEHVAPGSNWLDLGCGSGVLSRLLSDLGANVVGVDGSPRMIQNAIAESDRYEGRIRYVLINDIGSLPFSEGSYDGVLCSSVIEYLDDPGSALKEISRVLNSDGILIATVPNRHSLVRRVQKTIRYVNRMKFPYLDYSKNEYRMGTLIGILRKHCLGIDGFKRFDPVLGSALNLFDIGSIYFVIARKTL
jgi:2-polyprenyl-3-methyl-5-hydroxy-6-metoxy-1,4-benzoquinol methylase